MRLLPVRAALCALLAAVCSAAPSALTLPDGEAGVPYSWVLDGCGVSTEPDEVCDATLVNDALPPGLLLDSASRLTGSPTAKGVYNFTVRFQQYPHQIVDRVYRLEVKDGGGSPAAISVNRSVLYFGVSPDGRVKTSPQTVSITTPSEQGAGWSAISDNSRFTLNGHLIEQDTKARDFLVAAASGANREVMQGTITVTSSRPLPGSLHNIKVVESVVDSTAAPMGGFDTPLDNSVVWGTIPISGWALDNIEVTKVEIWREPVAGEDVPKGDLVYIGDANFIPDARPDVEAEHSETPLNYRAAWGYTVLTNGLPGADSATSAPNKVYKLHAIAHNKAGLTTDLGTRTITVDITGGAKPFGYIDTPAPCAAVSGQLTSFAWALTQPPYSIPADGSTIWVGLDGQVVGHPVYNQFREDVAAAFPDFVNSRGAVGYYQLDTGKLANGVHTISWVVADNGGRSAEIGSRAFQVRNGGAANSRKSLTPPPAPASSGGILLRRGFDPNQQPETLTPNQQGDFSLQMEQLGRIEVQLGAVDGYQLVKDQRRPLPIGSSIKDGTFYWQAGVGFLGRFHLVLVRADGSEARLDVNVVPKTYSPAAQ
ncbi:MAG TPA: putative Ig domain-containing protein [Bryobacteraceae bacterium]